MTGIGSLDRNRSAGIDLLSLPDFYFFVVVVVTVVIAAVFIVEFFLRGFIVVDEAIVYNVMNRSLFNTLI